MYCCVRNGGRLLQCTANRTLGSTKTIEAYIQESGRAGRDDNHACALLLVRKIKKYLHPDMVMYCKNTTVCRRSLLKNFDPIDFTKDCMGCMCCDVCACHHDWFQDE